MGCIEGGPATIADETASSVAAAAKEYDKLSILMTPEVMFTVRILLFPESRMKMVLLLEGSATTS